MSIEDDAVELTEADYTVVSTDSSPEREKELADQGIILNYRPTSVTRVSMIGSPDDHRSDNGRVLDHYHTMRARHHLDHLFVPMIRHAVRNPFDVLGPVVLRHTIDAVRGSMEDEIKANKSKSN